MGFELRDQCPCGGLQNRLRLRLRAIVAAEYVDLCFNTLKHAEQVKSFCGLVKFQIQANE